MTEFFFFQIFFFSNTIIKLSFKGQYFVLFINNAFVYFFDSLYWKAKEVELRKEFINSLKLDFFMINLIILVLKLDCVIIYKSFLSMQLKLYKEYISFKRNQSTYNTISKCSI